MRLREEDIPWLVAGLFVVAATIRVVFIASPPGPSFAQKATQVCAQHNGVQEVSGGYVVVCRDGTAVQP